MSTVLRDPLAAHWTTAAPGQATASALCQRLAPLAMADLAEITPAMAAAAAELALLADIPWRFSPDDPTTALLRMIARAAILAPDAGGPHCARLADLIDHRPTIE